MLGTGRVNKVFSPRDFISKKMIRNMQLAFTNVPYKCDIIQLVLSKSGKDLEGSSQSD